MTKTLAITAIALVAVVMGMSTIAPVLPQAFAHEVPRSAYDKAHEICDKRINLPEVIERIICNHR